MALLQAVTSSSIVKTKTLVLSIGVDWITSNFELQFCFLLYEYYFVSHTHFGWEIKLSEISHYWITIWMCAKEHIKPYFTYHIITLKRWRGQLVFWLCVRAQQLIQSSRLRLLHVYLPILI